MVGFNAKLAIKLAARAKLPLGLVLDNAGQQTFPRRRRRSRASARFWKLIECSTASRKRPSMSPVTAKGPRGQFFAERSDRDRQVLPPRMTLPVLRVILEAFLVLLRLFDRMSLHLFDNVSVLGQRRAIFERPFRYLCGQVERLTKLLIEPRLAVAQNHNSLGVIACISRALANAKSANSRR